MKHGSLFSGIGGFDLAAEWMGWENVFHCEWNEFGQKVLKHYWPKAISYADITKTDFTIHRGTIDILTGGFPCQPYSQAGKRLGKEDDRHLWPEMLRAVGEIQPRWIVGENVPGLVNWDGGLVFEEVQANLEAAGYEVTSFILPACGKNAPHRRERIWFIANSNMCRNNTNEGSKGNQLARKQPESSFKTGYERAGEISGYVNERVITHPESLRRRKGVREETNDSKRKGAEYIAKGTEIWDRDSAASRTRLSFQQSDFSGFPTQSPVCSGDDGFPSQMDGITFSKWRQESIKAGGNAIVPQVAHQIFKAIEQYENEKLHKKGQDN